MKYFYDQKNNLHYFSPECEYDYCVLYELSGDDILYPVGNFFDFFIPDNQKVSLEYIEELKKMLGAT